MLLLRSTAKLSLACLPPLPLLGSVAVSAHNFLLPHLLLISQDEQGEKGETRRIMASKGIILDSNQELASPQDVILPIKLILPLL